jgi:hypothetical protein
LAYEYIGNRYFTGRLETLFKFSYLFKDFSEIWRISGYAPCTQSNFLLRIFLVRSGLFNSEDIKRKHVFFNFILHQYLKIKIENKWLCVDVGEKQRGMPLGQHLKWFG